MTMHRVELDLELLTDVCVSQSNRTLGSPTTFTYLPGRSLWGAVATRAYTSGASPEDAFRLFHQGTVRILNAVPAAAGGRGYWTPLTWHVLKNEPDSKAIHNFALPEVRERELGRQFKTLSPQWLTASLTPIEVSTVFTLRASIDASGRARDGLLFGLPAIRSGTRFWSALVGPEKDVEVVARWMTEADLHLGRSRQTELGVVRVKRRKQPVVQLQAGSGRHRRVSFLCDSRCLLREPKTGAPTTVPYPEAFGLSAGWSFELADSCVRTARITHFHGQRKRPETERFAIEQGSVITFVSQQSDVDLGELAIQVEQGIGDHVGQGYGQVVVSPDWLVQPGFTLTSKEPETAEPVSPPSDELYKWAKGRADSNKVAGDAFEAALKFARELKQHNIPPAQWGALRRLAREHRFGARQELLKRVSDHLNSGRRKLTAWRRVGPDLETRLKDSHSPAMFLEFLAGAALRDSLEEE